MLLVRSWPQHPPPGRAYVVDGAQRLLNDAYDYSGLVNLDDNVLQLDWDTAVSRDDLVRFAAHARRDPDRPLVAPVPCYRPDGSWVWNCRRYLSEHATAYVAEGEPTCHLFGFGMVYLPLRYISGFVHQNPGALMDDTSFSGWYWRVTGRETVIDWSVRPVHLHYDIEAVPL